MEKYDEKMEERKVQNKKELTIEATVENIETVTEFVDTSLDAFDCPMKAKICGSQGGSD